MSAATDDADPRPPAAAILAAGQRLVTGKGTGFTTQDVIREAGVALQTFYRYFPGGKDELMLALIADGIGQHCARLRAAADGIDDPVARLELFVRTTLRPLRTPEAVAAAQFITAEHWRLHQHLAAEVWAATQPVTDLLRAELEAGLAAGLLHPRNPERDAWLMNKTLISAFHHYAFQPDDPAMTTIADDVWGFCLAAVGGTAGRPGRRRRR